MKRRIQKDSILICYEGKTEVAFLKYIKSLYLDGKRKHVRLKHAGSGGLINIKKTIENHKKHDFKP